MSSQYSFGTVLRSCVSVSSGVFVLTRPIRLLILWTWMSTGIEGMRKAYANTQFAVFLPTPGSLRSSSIVLGTWLRCCSCRILLSCLICFALVL